MEAPGSATEESSGTPNMRALLVILALTYLENAECLQQCFKMFQIIRRMMNALTQAEVSQVLSPWGIRLLKPMLQISMNCLP
jgi:hypothetical protein